MPAGSNPARGEAHGRAKLTNAEVRAIRSDGGTVYGIAKRFGISRRQVRRILDGDHWGHV
ncbi:MAG: helix-turn-helix domain-containing protein [Reyranella sp.]